jgi:outer membrane lipoprotein-sorting protein
MITTLFLALTVQAATAQTPAQAGPAPTEQAGIEQAAFDPDAALAGINAALNSVETLRARFIQVSPQGTFAEGLLSMSRPGRLRFEYDDPTPIRVISDGTTVAVEDTDLETVDRAPLRSTPLWWLLKRDIDIANDAEILDIISEFGFVYLTVQDPNGEMEGQIQFVFSESDYELREWFVTDAVGQVTRVTLIDAEAGIRLSPRLFIIPEPETERDSRRGRR